ncbi:Uncharacterised protein [Mycobacteroides abscessus subsp. abscessus]|uniref:DUF6573 family protein n=1 Tax=Mycobacteroides abscessus TaxID=36809 RepID=UPI000927A672|nr:DUF6573 family protein [Mycobacteroides abscessus]SHU85724.1 Uncharacterised protein [Mycobacteroides abscessus subsp. abscessus]
MEFKVEDKIDVTEIAAEAGFAGPVELTKAAWDELIAWSSTSGCQDEEGRLWDVLWMGFTALRKSGNAPEWLDFGLWRVPNTPRARVPRYAQCRMNIQINFAGKPSATIMLPTEARSDTAIPDPFGQPISKRPY